MKLVDQGLRYEHGLLCVMDGAKGIKKAVQDVFGDHAQIQRCMWHKRENVVGKLQRKEDQDPLRKELNKAYNQETYAQAKQALDEILQGLEMEGQQSEWKFRLAAGRRCPSPGQSGHHGEAQTQGV